MNRFDSAVVSELRQRGNQDLAAFVREHHVGAVAALSPAEAALEADLLPDPEDAEAVAQIADDYEEYANDLADADLLRAGGTA